MRARNIKQDSVGRTGSISCRPIYTGNASARLTISDGADARTAVLTTLEKLLLMKTRAQTDAATARSRRHATIGATTLGTGGDWSPQLVPPTFRLGTNNVMVLQLLGRSFQKAKNFTADSRSPECRIKHLSLQKFSGGRRE